MVGHAFDKQGHVKKIAHRRKYFFMWHLVHFNNLLCLVYYSYTTVYEHFEHIWFSDFTDLQSFISVYFI